MGVQCRGVQNIRTLSAVRGAGVYSNERHVKQFQVACLELERARLTREMAAVVKRIKDIDARLREIDTLVRKHQEALWLGSDGATREDRAPGGGEAPKGSGRQRTLRY